MKQDIGGVVRAVAAARRGESEWSGQATLRWLAEQLQGSTPDWDDGAGECWGRVLVSGRVVAFVFMEGPLAIVSAVPEATVAAMSPHLVAVLRVEDMEDEVMCSDREALEELAGRELSSNFDHRQFSADDLVWATI